MSRRVTFAITITMLGCATTTPTTHKAPAPSKAAIVQEQPNALNGLCTSHAVVEPVLTAPKSTPACQIRIETLTVAGPYTGIAFVREKYRREVYGLMEDVDRTWLATRDRNGTWSRHEMVSDLYEGDDGWLPGLGGWGLTELSANYLKVGSQIAVTALATHTDAPDPHGNYQYVTTWHLSWQDKHRKRHFGAATLKVVKRYKHEGPGRHYLVSVDAGQVTLKERDTGTIITFGLTQAPGDESWNFLLIDGERQKEFHSRYIEY